MIFLHNMIRVSKTPIQGFALQHMLVLRSDYTIRQVNHEESDEFY